jgi:hypothetical protein
MISKIKSKIAAKAESGLESINSGLAHLSRMRHIRSIMTEEGKYLDQLMVFFDSAKIATAANGTAGHEPELVDSPKGLHLSEQHYGPLPLEPKKVFDRPLNLTKDLVDKAHTVEELAEIHEYYRDLARAFLNLHRLVRSWSVEYLKQNNDVEDTLYKIFSSFEEYFDALGYHEWFTANLRADAAKAIERNETLLEEIRPALQGWAREQHVEKDVRQLADDAVWMYDHLYRGGSKTHPDFRFRLGRAMAKLDVVNKEIRTRNKVHAQIAVSRYRAAQVFGQMVDSGEQKTNLRKNDRLYNVCKDWEAAVSRSQVSLIVGEVIALFMSKASKHQVIVWQNDMGHSSKAVLHSPIDVHDKISTYRSYVPQLELLSALSDRMQDRCTVLHRLFDGPTVAGELNPVEAYGRSLLSQRFFRRRAKWAYGDNDRMASTYQSWDCTAVFSTGFYDGSYENIVSTDSMTPMEVFKSHKHLVVHVKHQAPLRLGDLMWAMATVELMSPGLNRRHAERVKQVLDAIHPGEYGRLIAALEPLQGKNGPLLGKIFRLSDDQ